MSGAARPQNRRLEHTGCPRNKSPFGVPLNGVPAAPLQLTDRSRLRIRLPDDQTRLRLEAADNALTKDSGD